MPIGIREGLIILALIILLNYTGWWPRVIRSLRELRGDVPPEDAPGQSISGRNDAELSYKLLGLTPSASWEEIEKAYRQKAKVHHPDRGGDEDAMRALNDAYRLLKSIKGR